jgi:membrane-anchored protein YejM (alkaline phosphatase superfamily)
MNCFDTFHPDSIAPDFLHRLGSLGYATAVYSPTRYAGGMDEALFRSIDFKEQIFPDPDGLLPNVSGYDGQASWKTKRIALDLATLNLMKEDLNRWLAAGRKLAVAFVPQVGHLPYPDLDPREEGENLVGRGRAMIAMQDAWLGEILDLLEKYGQLDKTVIVILGDHGTRTLREDPSLRRGTIDESSFHVPLFIYAPRTLAHEERIPWLTSHIDVAPTVLDLLGIQGGRGSEQGTPMWDPLLAERTTFLFAEPFFGADGYYSQGNFFMWHYLSDVVYVNSQARFDTSEIVPRYSSQAGDVTRSITKMVGLEKAWHARFSEPMPRRTQASALRGSR